MSDTETLQSAPDRVIGNHIMVRAEGLRLLLPQRDVKSIQHIAGTPHAVDQSGLMQLAGHDEEYFLAVSAKLQPLSEFPAQRFLSTLLPWEGGVLRWCWNEVRMLSGISLQQHAIPPVLMTPAMPMRSFVEHEGHVVFPCTAERLTQFVLAGAVA